MEYDLSKRSHFRIELKINGQLEFVSNYIVLIWKDIPRQFQTLLFIMIYIKNIKLSQFVN